MKLFFLTDVSNYCEERKIKLSVNVYIKIARNLGSNFWNFVSNFLDFWQFFSNFLAFQWATFQHFTSTIGIGLAVVHVLLCSIWQVTVCSIRVISQGTFIAGSSTKYFLLGNAVTNIPTVPSVLPIKRTNRVVLRVCKSINQSEPEGQILTQASTWKWDLSPRRDSCSPLRDSIAAHSWRRKIKENQAIKIAKNGWNGDQLYLIIKSSIDQQTFQRMTSTKCTRSKSSTLKTRNLLRTTNHKNISAQSNNSLSNIFSQR